MDRSRQNEYLYFSVPVTESLRGRQLHHWTTPLRSYIKLEFASYFLLYLFIFCWGGGGGVSYTPQGLREEG